MNFDNNYDNSEFISAVEKIKSALFDITSTVNVKLYKLNDDSNENVVKLREELKKRSMNIIKYSNDILNEISIVDKYIDLDELIDENNDIIDEDYDLSGKEFVPDTIENEEEIEMADTNSAEEADVEEENAVDEKPAVAVEKIDENNSDDSDDVDDADDSDESDEEDEEEITADTINDQMDEQKTSGSTTDVPADFEDKLNSILNLPFVSKINNKSHADETNAEVKDEKTGLEEDETDTSNEETVDNQTDNSNDSVEDASEEASEDETVESSEENDIEQTDNLEENTQEEATEETVENEVVDSNEESQNQEDNIENKNDVTSDEPVVEIATDAPNEEQTADTNDDIIKEESSVEINVPEVSNDTQIENTSTNENNNTGDVKVSFTLNKSNKDLAKAILVSEKQYNTLEKSLSSQRALCKFRNLLTNVDDISSGENVNLESLINQANELYKNGDVEGAEKLFNKVSELNNNNNN